MQTFLPVSSFAESAKILDSKRLGKQRVEVKQIHRALTEEGVGWRHHPAVTMWRRREEALLLYGVRVCLEWRRRGYEDNLLSSYFASRLSLPSLVETTILSFLEMRERIALGPWWLGDERFHRSHQSNLLRKDPIYYGQFGWDVSPNLAYFWPGASA